MSATRPTPLSRRGGAAVALTTALGVSAALVLPAAGPAVAAPTASAALTASAAPAAAAPVERTRLTVRLDGAAGLDASVRAAQASGGALSQRLPALRSYSVSVPRHLAPRLRAVLAARPGVRDVRVAQRRAVSFVPADPQYPSQTSYLREIGAQAAWDTARGSVGVRIAVVDSGVDVRHPDLRSKIAGSWNAVRRTTDVTDRMGHGTFVAGVAAAATDNGVGVAGVGFRSRLLAVKVASDNGDIWTDDEAAGIVWAADHGAKVINISLGSYSPDALEADAVAYARRKGAVVVAAAGNESTTRQSYPAALPGVIAVGATQGTRRAGFSNSGNWVDVGAPGVALRSTAPNGRYATGSGTSFSSPLVAGQVALMAAAHPRASGARLADAVRTGTTGSYGFARGRVSLPAALRALGPQRVRVTSFSPDPFSPNRDGRRDAARLTFALAATEPVTVTIRSAGGTRVYGPRALGTLRAGVHSLVWNGRDAAGRARGNGSYTASVLTRSGRGTGTVVLDRAVPALSSLTGAGARFDPAQRRFTPSVVTPETLSSLSLVVYNRAGKRLRVIRGGPKPVGRVGVSWDGRRPDGSGYPSGTYLFRLVAHDLAGNERVTRAYRVTLVR